MQRSICSHLIFIFLLVISYSDYDYGNQIYNDLSKNNYNVKNAESFNFSYDKILSQLKIVQYCQAASYDNAEDSKYGITAAVTKYYFTTRRFSNFCGESNIIFLKILACTNKSPPYNS
jgi:hypothetical protein